MELTYEMIKPLIVKEEPGENNTIRLAVQAEFLPRSGQKKWHYKI